MQHLYRDFLHFGLTQSDMRAQQVLGLAGTLLDNGTQDVRMFGIGNFYAHFLGEFEATYDAYAVSYTHLTLPTIYSV